MSIENLDRRADAIRRELAALPADPPPVLDESELQRAIAAAKVSELQGAKGAVSKAEAAASAARAEHGKAIEQHDKLANARRVLHDELDAIAEAREELIDQRTRRRRAAARSRLDHLAAEYKAHLECAVALLPALVEASGLAFGRYKSPPQDAAFKRHAESFSAPLFSEWGIDPDNDRVHSLSFIQQLAITPSETLAAELEAIQ